METIEQYVDALVEAKGFDTKDPEVLDQIKSDLLDRVEDRINAMVITSLDESAHVEFGKVLDGGDPDEIQAFIKAQIPDIEERVATELLAFKAIYLG